MNYSIVRNMIGKIMILVGSFMILPLLVCLIYQERFVNYLSFIIPMCMLIGIGILFNVKKGSPKMTVKEAFTIVSISWITISLFGALPLFISRYYTNFIDAFFEITSGFTTTGASITSSDTLELLMAHGRSMLFWRSFTHWVGGMGVLVFILSIIPESNEGSIVHVLRAESPGPIVERLATKVKTTSRILYLIYIVLTFLEIVLLLGGRIFISGDESMSLFDSVIYSLGTAGTGGFGIRATSVETYAPYYQYVISIFMIIFGVNFSLYYLLLLGKAKEVIKNEELLVYLSIIVVAVVLITINTRSVYSTFEETFRQSLFQTTSAISTTGYSTTNSNAWPTLSKTILVFLMVIGSCAGSTAGGAKVSRLIILVKSSLLRVRQLSNPRKVTILKLNGQKLSNETTNSVFAFYILYLLILGLSSLLISIDGYSLETKFSASLACLSNIGPGFDMVGPYGSYASFSCFSKIVLSLVMIFGRLEIFPLMFKFNYHNYQNRFKKAQLSVQ